MTGDPHPAIRTPDQRIRVFVSSTLRELADERRAVRGAVESLRLAPVMFELGARPHPPRDLYRSYLRQSDVFIGVYGDSYGWVAPGEEISGLEDEYRLAPRGMPKLIYLRESGSREDRLSALVMRIQDDDTASYKTFSSAAELADLVRADLATLLAERFDAAAHEAVETAPPIDSPVPAAYSRIIGRDDAISEVAGLLASAEHRVVTLLGPGGIGKSRLAIAVAGASAESFPDGIAFVSLENVLEPPLLLPTIAHALGVRETSEIPLLARLAIALEGRRMLVVLDNFEQLVGSAAELVRLYTVAPDVRFLVTSRTVLRIRGERVYDVLPLSTDGTGGAGAHGPAVELLVERARAVKPDFELTEANAPALVGICRALDGLPLAIELAAARMRVLTPDAMLQRLDCRLPLLADASRDLPERQRTLRATIEWSTALLSPEARTALYELSVFSPGFTLDSAEAFAAARGWEFDAFDAISTLVDSSLMSQTARDGESLFSTLATVREHGVESLGRTGSEAAARDAHAGVYVDLARREGGALGFAQQASAVSRLNLERGNLRAAVRHLASVGDAETAADLAWSLFLYWWVGEYLAEVGLWMEELLSASDAAALSPRTRAIALFYVGWRDMWREPTHGLVASLLRAAELFEESGDELGQAMTIATSGLAEINTATPDIAAAAARLSDGAARFHALGAGWGESLSLVALGRIAWLSDDEGRATELFRDAVAASRRSGDPFTATVATHHLGRMMLFAGRLDESRALFDEAARASVELRHEEGIAYGLEGLCAIAAVRGDVERAGILSGAAASIRKRTAIFDAPIFVYHPRYLEQAAADADAAVLAAAIARGGELDAFAAAEYALDAGPR